MRLLLPSRVYAGVLIVTAILAGTAAAQTGPRTPWGDPDLQGTYTNKYETSTPLERPKEFEGRRIADITAAELAAAVRKRQEDTLARAKFFGGDPEGLHRQLGGIPRHLRNLERESSVVRDRP